MSVLDRWLPFKFQRRTAAEKAPPPAPVAGEAQDLIPETPWSPERWMKR